MLDRHDTGKVDLAMLKNGLKLCGLTRDNVSHEHLQSLTSAIAKSDARSYGYATSFSKDDYVFFVREAIAKKLAKRGL